jgi:hypothetical protein
VQQPQQEQQRNFRRQAQARMQQPVPESEQAQRLEWMTEA